MPIVPNMRTWDVLDGQGHPMPRLGLPGVASRPVQESTSVVEKEQAFIDTPQILYSKWPKASGIKRPLGTFTGTPPKIVCIGGGLANCAAAFELAKAGADVTLLEAADKVGGRLCSMTADGINFEEMGAMRFPPSEDLLYYYAHQLGFEFLKDKFPDPGAVQTLLYQSDKAQTEVYGLDGKAPADFTTVFKGWHGFMDNGLYKDGKQTHLGAKQMADRLRRSHLPKDKDKDDPLEEVKAAWQEYLKTFGSDSLNKGLRRIFGPNGDWTIPGGDNVTKDGQVWSEEEFTRFSKFGDGSGGFGAFNNLGFNAMFRFFVNGLETHQHMFAENGKATGIQRLAEKLITEAMSLPTPLKVQTGCFGTITQSTPTKVTVNMAAKGANPGRGSEDFFDYALVGTTNRVAASRVLVAPSIVASAAMNALENVHICNSTKLAIRTKNFWKNDSNIPRVIMSDKPFVSLYTLEYDSDAAEAIVLVTYAWEDDSKALEQYGEGDGLYEYLLSGIKQVAGMSDGWKDWADNLDPHDWLYAVHWQLPPKPPTQPLTLGAFVIGKPAEDSLTSTLFYDFEKLTSPTAASPDWSPILLNGDSYTFSGGWTQGALMSAMNNVSAILQKHGTLENPDLAPTNRISSSTFNY